MFVRIKSTPNSPRKSVQLVASYRQDGQARQRVLRHIGVALDEEGLQRLRNLGEYVKAKLETDAQPALFPAEDLARLAVDARQRSDAQDSEPLTVNLKKLREEQRVVSGVHEVLGAVYRELGFGKLLGARRKAAARNLFHTVMGRLANPQSKRATVAALEEEFGVHLNLQSVYRMMDSIDEKIVEKAKRMAGEAARGLLGCPVQLLFCDCTTLYFESFTEDDLKQNGYSKDRKFNQPQVMLGLLATEEGLPVDYEVYPGNQFEGKTLETAVNNIRKSYDLKAVIFTADSALLSKENLALLDKLEVHYIIAARLKSLPGAWKRAVLDTKAYQSSESGAPCQRIREWDSSGGRRLIVTYSRKRAAKDRQDREKAVQKLRAKLAKSENPTSLISNYGYKRFLRIEGDSKVVLEDKKLAAAARWDGLHGVMTSAAELPASQAIEQYRKLWQIEDCFRVAKHDLRIRPIFHWTPARVRAHLLVCFLALVCLRCLAYRVRLRFEAMSPARIVRTLNSVQASILRDTATNRRYVLPSQISEDARKLYTTMALKPDSTPYEIPQS
jgi:transposase